MTRTRRQQKTKGRATLRADVVVVAPSLLEPATVRGGGIESVDLKMSSYLSQTSRVALLGPFYPRYTRTKQVNVNCWIDEVPFPAQHRYPPTSRLSEYMIVFFLAPLYALLLSLKISWMPMKKPAILVVHNGLPGLCASLVGVIRHCLIIFSEGNTYPWTNPYMREPEGSIPKRVMYRLKLASGIVISQLSKCVRAQSPSILEGLVRAGVNPAKVRVVPAGIDIPPLPSANAHQSEDGLFRVGFIGRLNDEKGAPLLAEIVRRAQAELPSVRFVIMGDGVHRSLFEKQSNVEQLGWLSGHEVSQAMAHVDTLVFFQREVGLGELESMAAGKAIIACDAGEMRSIISDQVNGILRNPDAESFIEGIKLLQSDPALRQQISGNARHTARNRYDWNVVGPEWIRLFASVTG